MEINKSSKKFQNEDFVVIKLNDEILSLNNNDAIKEYFDNELTAGNKNFIIDMSDVSTITSSGLGILISILNKVRQNGGQLKLDSLNNKILEIFKITKINLIFDFI
jgi:anti-sigma B factor antagonist